MLGGVGEGDRDRVGVVLVDRAVADRVSSARVSSSRATLTSFASGPSPMSSTRRENAYSADIARRLGVGSSRMP
ncbi:hypothetical protein GCM10023238_30740 [Streptomyces heliomycini]